MNAPLAARWNDAERVLADQFAARRSLFAASPKIADQRVAAFDRFSNVGIPNRRVEAWHYTDLRSAMRTMYPVAEAPDNAAREAARALVDRLKQADHELTIRLVMLDGVYDAELSSGHLPTGVRLTSTYNALITGDERAVRAFAAVRLGEDDPMVALNGALSSGGILIDVDDGVMIGEPVEIVYITSGAMPMSVYSRSAIILGEGSGIRLVERRLGVGNAPTQSNDALFLSIGRNAYVRHCAAYASAPAATTDIASLLVELHEGAVLQSYALMFGAGLRRRQGFVRFAGPQARCAFGGVSLLRGDEHADTTIVMEHATPNCESREAFHHIIDGDATGVFQGRIRVAPHAQKTDGRMRSRAILLSDGAAMYNKPELEIFADDVMCGHGATCGQLDENQLFYAQSRGLPKAEAEALILEGFAGEIINEIGNESLRETLMTEARGWLARRGQ